MKTFRVAIVFGILSVAAGATSAQVVMQDPREPGSSPHSAVRIVAVNELMVDRYIKSWLRKHYPGWDADPYETQEIGTERYAIVYLTTANHPARRVYFRLSSRLIDPEDDAFPL